MAQFKLNSLAGSLPAKTPVCQGFNLRLKNVSRARSGSGRLARTDEARALVTAAAAELKRLQSQGASLVFQVKSEASGSRREAFSVMHLADILVLAEGGRSVMLRFVVKGARASGQALWEDKLRGLGHSIITLRCETPLDAKEQLRDLLVRKKIISEENPLTKGQAKSLEQANSLFSARPFAQ